MDIRRYFESVDHGVLLRLLGERVRDEGILWLCRELLDGALRSFGAGALRSSGAGALRSSGAGALRSSGGRPDGTEGGSGGASGAGASGAGASGAGASGAGASGAGAGAEAGEPRGLPIGNLTSQFWANVYLHPLDERVMGRLGQGTYMRYMDDLLVFGRDKAVLWEVAAEVKRYASEVLRLEVKQEATVVSPVSEGVAWLGCRVFAGTTRLDRASRSRFVRGLSGAAASAARSPLAEQEQVARATSQCGHAAHADTLGLRRGVVEELHGMD
jgi:hypothetical protein